MPSQHNEHGQIGGAMASNLYIQIVAVRLDELADDHVKMKAHN